MTFGGILLLIYGLMNTLACILMPLLSVSLDDDEFWDILIYPKLIRWLRETLSIPGTIIVTVLFTICFLPALIVDFVIYFAMLIAILLGGLFVLVFKRRD